MVDVRDAMVDGACPEVTVQGTDAINNAAAHNGNSPVDAVEQCR